MTAVREIQKADTTISSEGVITSQQLAMAEAVERIRPFTQVPEGALTDLAYQVRAVLKDGIPGDLIECGVWRGGASFLMADLLRRSGATDRKVWMFDSFEGLPPPQTIDGPKALQWARDTDDPMYFDNCRASLEEVESARADLGLTAYTRPVKGWFEDTLPRHRGEIGPIAILRIDGDWYSSVRCVLENLYDQVSPGGIVILDDYYAFDGCALALHEFLGKRMLDHRLESVYGIRDYLHCVAFRKGGRLWTSVRRDLEWIDRAVGDAAELRDIIPSGAQVILVEDSQIGQELLPWARTIPFLERDGVYWGEPEDDATAIRELERLHEAGAGFIAFTGSTGWWLDYYTGFRDHLRSRYCCLLETQRNVVFDLTRPCNGSAQ